MTEPRRTDAERRHMDTQLPFTVEEFRARLDKINSLIHYMLRALRYPAYRGIVPPPADAEIRLARVRAGRTRLAAAP